MTEPVTTSPMPTPYSAPPVAVSPAPTRPPTPWWAYVFAVAGVLLVLGLVAAGVTAAAVAMSTSVVTDSIEADGVQRLQVEAVTGSVTVRTEPTMGDRVEITTRTVSTWQEPELVREQAGEVLDVALDCPRQGWLNRCEGSFDVVMGPDTELDISLVTGGVDGTALAGDVDIQVVTGGVMLERLASETVSVDITTGGVDLDFAQPPTDVLADVSVGGVTIAVPDDGTVYDVAVSSGVGGEDVTVDTSGDSDNRIEVATSVGGTEVRYR